MSEITNNDYVIKEMDKEKYSVSTEFTIPIGHRLSKNDDKCFNLHGHNFKFVVTICSDELNDEDMVIDFRHLKEIMKEFKTKYDHSLVINKSDEFISENKEICDNFKVIKLEKDPTAEVLAKELFNFLTEKFEKIKTKNHLEIQKVRVYESGKSFAEFSVIRGKKCIIK